MAQPDVTTEGLHSGATSGLSGGTHRSDRIVRFSLSEQIAERLRDDIVHGRIPAGTHLVQDELCDRFGTSRMPVRDALQQLTHEGMLEQHGQQRIVVALGSEDLEETHGLIAVLHGWAAGRVAALASDEELEELAEICQAGEEAADAYEFGRLAMEFHRKINFLARSPRLIRTLISFQQAVPRTTPFTLPEEMPASKARHRAIVAALQARDAERAEQLTRAHSMLTVTLLQAFEAGRYR